MNVYPDLYVPPREADAPVVTVTGACPSTIPVASKDVPVAAPMAGVTSAKEDASCVPVIVLDVMSAATIRELVTVCVDPAKCAMPTPGLEALTTFAATTVLSVSVHVVVAVVHPTKCPVAMTAVGPSIVLLVVLGDDPMVNVPAPVALPKAKVPVVFAGLPIVGVIVQDAADVLVALGTAPTAVLVAFVPPLEMVTVGRSPAAIAAEV